MAYISIVRARVRPGSGESIEQALKALLAGRLAWREAGDLLDTWAVRAEGGAEYALVSVWRDRAAHDRHEDAPEEAEALRGAAAMFAGPPEELTGEVIAQL